MQRAEVIHGGGSEHHQGADNERAFHVGQSQAKVGFQTSAGLLMELRDLKFFAPECVNHPDRAQSFLRLS